MAGDSLSICGKRGWPRGPGHDATRPADAACCRISKRIEWLRVHPKIWKRDCFYQSCRVPAAAGSRSQSFHLFVHDLAQRRLGFSGIRDNARSNRIRRICILTFLSLHQSHSSSNRGSTSRNRRSCRRYDLEKLEDRTLLSFTPISRASGTLPNGMVYTAGTTNLASGIPANGTTTTSLTDGIETVAFSQTMTAATVPGGGLSNWGSPPTPRPTPLAFSLTLPSILLHCP